MIRVLTKRKPKLKQHFHNPNLVKMLLALGILFSSLTLYADSSSDLYYYADIFEEEPVEETAQTGLLEDESDQENRILDEKEEIALLDKLVPIPKEEDKSIIDKYLEPSDSKENNWDIDQQIDAFLSGKSLDPSHKEYVNERVNHQKESALQAKRELDELYNPKPKRRRGRRANRKKTETLEANPSLYNGLITDPPDQYTKELREKKRFIPN